MVNVRHIFVLFQFLDQFLDRSALLLGHLLRVGRDSLELPADNLVTVILQVLLNGSVRFERPVDHHFLTIDEHLVHAAIDQFEFQLFDIHPFFHRSFENALVIEHKRHRSRSPERTAELVEIAANVSYGTRRIVGRRLDNHRDPERSVSFVHHLFVVAHLFRRGPFDRAFDVLFRHIGGFRILNQHSEVGITRRIRPSGLHGNRDFLSQFGKSTGHVAPSFQFACFSILKCSSHNMFCSFSFF